MAVDPILRPWKALVALGRQRGYVTRAELREVIPVGTWGEQFEEIAVGLHEQGIRIVPDDEAGGAMPAAAGPPPGPIPAPEAPLSDRQKTPR
ncbi:RNA polymerase sigma factor region1.1 domain-containing protein [Sabulicella glaciei]|uniref:RNA polymerase sigma factor region1.1 domain-containing protein n=1 Tax=Sabulicella glaciei TaxID=2984948 RepID=A0ABT3NWF0_9PROT|nr:RNA polymerase sigma factor region1.1 domain-containing protein [Roseococcus sp. MDT2-1-1]MCW8086501.1 RNA polymerase sigma factor region1.1 domain-containing protein [Roseococcus sp. MDT2-1-1]